VSEERRVSEHEWVPPAAPGRLKGNALGRRLAALRRRRRVPRTWLRSRAAARADRRAGRPAPPPPPPPRRVRSVVCFLVGPGELEALSDSIESVLRSDGDDTQVIVVDDATPDVREADVRERFPEVDVVRNRVGTGGPPNLWPTTALGLRRALERYDFEQWVKLDTDALITAPALSEAMLARIAAGGERVGMAGCHGLRADGVRETYEWHASVLALEERHDPVLRDAAARARANGWRDGEQVHGGVFAITRAAAEAIAAEGWLGWKRPWHSLTSEDFTLALFCRALGFELLSIGGPDGIIATANKHTPLPKDVVADGPWVAAHSIRHGLDGEDEAEMRAYFRARRAEWPSARGAQTSAQLGAGGDS
jgi:hypothetical protein